MCDAHLVAVDVASLALIPLVYFALEEFAAMVACHRFVERVHFEPVLRVATARRFYIVPEKTKRFIHF